MDATALLLDAASRPAHAAGQVLDGLSTDSLHARPLERGSSIAWLVWHAARQQDVQVAALSGTPQVWDDGDWAERLGVARGSDDFGFGDDADAVSALHVQDADALLGYVEAVVAAVSAYISTLNEAALAEVVDRSYDPPVTRGVRLVSVIDDAVAHLGQAAYVRGLVERWSIGY